MKNFQDAEAYTQQGLDHYDTWVTIGRQTVYADSFHQHHVDTGVEQKGPDELFSSVFGPNHVAVASAFVGVGVAAAALSIVVKYFQDKRKRELASLHYLMMQLAKLYGNSPASVTDSKIKIANGLNQERQRKSHAYSEFVKSYHYLNVITHPKAKQEHLDQIILGSPVAKRAELEDLIRKYRNLRDYYEAYHSRLPHPFKRRALKKRLGGYLPPELATLTRKKDAEDELVATYKDIKKILMGEDREDLRDPVYAAKMRMVKLFNQSLRQAKNAKGELQQYAVKNIDLELVFTGGIPHQRMKFEEKTTADPDKLRASHPHRFFAEDLGVPTPRPKDRFTQKFESLSTGKQNFVDTLMDAVGALRLFLFQNSLFYWVGWFAVWAITGVTLVTSGLFMGLAFGLPLVIPAVFFVAKIVSALHKVYKNRRRLGYDLLSEPEEDNVDVDFTDFSRLLYADARANVLKQQYQEQHAKVQDYVGAPRIVLTDKEKALLYNGHLTVAAFIQGNQVAYEREPTLAQFDIEKTPEPVKSFLETSYQFRVGRFSFSINPRKVMAAISGFVSGYVITFFSSWPIQDFVNAMTVGASGYGLISLGVVLGVGAIVGIYYAVQGVRRTGEAILDEVGIAQKKQGVLEKISNELTRRETLKSALDRQATEITRLQQQVHHKPDLKNMLKPASSDVLSVDQINTLYRELNPEAVELKGLAKLWDLATSAFLYLVKFIFAGGTGSLVVRTVLQVGMIAAAFVAPQVFLALGVTLAVLYGSFKVYELYKQRQREQQQLFLNQAESRLHELSKDTVLAEKQLEMQEKYMELLKGQIKVEKDNGLVAPLVPDVQQEDKPVSSPMFSKVKDSLAGLIPPIRVSAKLF